MRLQLSQDGSLREIACVVAGLPTEPLSADGRSPCSSGKLVQAEPPQLSINAMDLETQGQTGVPSDWFFESQLTALAELDLDALE